jgi:hypothetical protein
MSVHFEGFPRVLNARALKPGRWFMAPSPHGPSLCLLTEILIDEKALVLTFSTGKIDTVEFRTTRLEAIAGPLTTLEDDIIFAPGEGGENLRLMAPGKRPFPSGALLRLSNGDMGVGFAESPGGELLIISLASGQRAEAFDLIFDRWSLSLRRGDVHALVGHFKGPGWRS